MDTKDNMKITTTTTRHYTTDRIRAQYDEGTNTFSITDKDSYQQIILDFDDIQMLQDLLIKIEVDHKLLDR